MTEPMPPGAAPVPSVSITTSSMRLSIFADPSWWTPATVWTQERERFRLEVAAPSRGDSKMYLARYRSSAPFSNLNERSTWSRVGTREPFFEGQLHRTVESAMDRRTMKRVCVLI
jgi:hypothetical protein